MDKQQLIARRVQTENSFSDFAKQRDTKQAEINDIETELARLQGEHRLLIEQINIVEAKESKAKITKKSKVSPEANVLNVDEGVQNG